MKFVRLLLSPYKSHFFKEASDVEMAILGQFLTGNVSCGSLSFKEWIFNDRETSACGNTICLEKEDSYILMSDMYSEEEVPTKLKLTQVQYLQIFDEWQEKVCKLKPKEVIIKYEDDQFIMEMKT
jgi:hypothetical protein